MEACGKQARQKLAGNARGQWWDNTGEQRKTVRRASRGKGGSRASRVQEQRGASRASRVRKQRRVQIGHLEELAGWIFEPLHRHVLVHQAAEELVATKLEVRYVRAKQISVLLEHH